LQSGFRRERIPVAQANNGLAQPFGTFQVGRNNGFKFINDRETALKLGDDATLLSKRGDRNREEFDITYVEMG
jgi:hypothetical protein